MKGHCKHVFLANYHSRSLEQARASVVLADDVIELSHNVVR